MSAKRMEVIGEVLKSCPHCGSASVCVHFGKTGKGRPNATCLDCYAAGGECDTVGAAISAWNKLVEDAQAGEEGEGS